MAEHDLVAADLDRDPRAVVVMQMDELRHIEWIRVQSGGSKWGRPVSYETLQLLVRSGALLTAPRLTPERTWVHTQPGAVRIKRAVRA